MRQSSPIFGIKRREQMMFLVLISNASIQGILQTSLSVTNILTIRKRLKERLQGKYFNWKSGRTSDF
jgi:hypothetical protein